LSPQGDGAGGQHGGAGGQHGGAGPQAEGALSETDWAALEEAAARVRERAHAPYSGYLVGAALLGDDGRVYAGCNVENASYGLCLCAERVAVGAAVAAGVQRFRGAVVATQGARAAAPCGMCRQVLAEFPPSFPVRCVSDAGHRLDTTVDALLPHAFGPSYLDDELRMGKRP
jgi:cytidine deaminase